MLAFLKDPVQRGWAAMALFALLALALVGPFLVGADDRHLTAFRDGAEDASLAREELDGKAGHVGAYLSTLHQLADVEDPTKTLLVVLGVERRYSEGEAAAILAFLERGGRVILADEGGYGNDIAKEAGWGFVGTSLLDTRNHLNDPKLVVSTARVDGRDFRVLLNHPTALQPLRNAAGFEVLARSSHASYPDGSYLDRNENGEIDINDAASPDTSGFPLIVRAPLGEGVLVLVADTGAFMNAQMRLGEYQNDDFLAALAGTLIPADGVVLLDESRHAPPPLLSAYDNAVRTLGRLTAGSVAPIVTILLVLLATLGAWYATRETEDWSHHEHNVGVELPVPPEIRPDLDRAQRMARRRISERFNIPLEQVAAMPAEQLVTLTGDRPLAEAAAGTLKSDPAPLFKHFSEATR